MRDIVVNGDPKDPIVTGALGVVASGTMWLMQFIEGFARIVGTLAGAGSAVLFFLVALQRYREGRRRPLKRPADADDEIPM